MTEHEIYAEMAGRLAALPLFDIKKDPEYAIFFNNAQIKTSCNARFVHSSEAKARQSLIRDISRRIYEQHDDVTVRRLLNRLVHILPGMRFINAHGDDLFFVTNYMDAEAILDLMIANGSIEIRRIA